MKILLPLKSLSVNKAWSGRRFKSVYYKEFEKEVCALLPFSHKTITSEVEIHYTFYVKNYKMSDVDNMIKPIQDLIIAREYLKDDRQIVFLSAEKVKSEKESIEIEIINYGD